jgi:hypothetical protein
MSSRLETRISLLREDDAEGNMLKETLIIMEKKAE